MTLKISASPKEEMANLISDSNLFNKKSEINIFKWGREKENCTYRPFEMDVEKSVASTEELLELITESDEVARDKTQSYRYPKSKGSEIKI